MRLRRCLIAVSLFFFESCGENMVSNKFCSLPAHFLFTPVNSISQLYTSCNSMGEWCTIEISGNWILFTKFDGSQGTANLTALDGYTRFNPGLSGFIVGLPNIPELGETTCVVTCYDRACRNCWEDYTSTKPLALKEGGYAYCSRCKRTYNLNNVGQVNQGDAGKPLYRYRVYYGNNTISVDNR